MTFDPTALLDLWETPHPDASAAAAAFRRLYCDPVLINGAAVSVDELVDRARSLQLALTDARREIVDICDAGDQVALAFQMSGRQVTMRVIDILTFTDGRISRITMVAETVVAAPNPHEGATTPEGAPRAP